MLSLRRLAASYSREHLHSHSHLTRVSVEGLAMPRRKGASSAAASSAAAADADDAHLPAPSHPTPPPADLLTKAERIRKQLHELYPPPVAIPLDHASPFQLLCAVVLSAQSTDLKVNEATPALFARAPDPKSMAKLGADGILPYVRTVGLAPTKARNLANLSALLLERHDGQVPSTLADLVALPGVGRKTASVVLSQAFGGRAFPVDTHIHRLAQRWGLTPPSPRVEQTESDLRALFPPESWRDAHLQIIYFGREHCPAKGHDADACPICSWASPEEMRGGGGAGAAAMSPVKAGGAAATPKKRRPAAQRSDEEEEEAEEKGSPWGSSRRQKQPQRGRRAKA
jgi:endonuclease-3